MQCATEEFNGWSIVVYLIGRRIIAVGQRAKSEGKQTVRTMLSAEAQSVEEAVSTLKTRITKKWWRPGR